MTGARSFLVLDRAKPGRTLALARWSGMRFVDMLLEWHERSRQRRALMALDDRLLKDIGISRADAERETSKPFWRL
jgi:uncharacterized protein YjiS (DUF1127 family)